MSSDAQAADAIIFGAPTYMGSVSWQFKKFAEIDVPTNERDPLGGSGEDATLHEAQASYFSMFKASAKPRSLLSILADTGYENDLSASWRLAVILAIMLFGVVGFAVLVNVVEGLSRIY